MKIAATVAAALVASVSLAGAAVAHESRNGAKPKSLVSRQIVRTSLVSAVEIHPAADRPARERCDTLLCPSFMVLGSGY